MKKYDLSKIMKRAWELVKKAGMTISSGLKKAWQEAKEVKKDKKKPTKAEVIQMLKNSGMSMEEINEIPVLYMKKGIVAVGKKGNIEEVRKNAEIRNKLSLGNETRGWFDFIPRANGNLSIKWRGPAT